MLQVIIQISSFKITKIISEYTTLNPLKYIIFAPLHNEMFGFWETANMPNVVVSALAGYHNSGGMTLYVHDWKLNLLKWVGQKDEPEELEVKVKNKPRAGSSYEQAGS